MFGNGNQLTRIEQKIDESAKGVHERLNRHEDKQDKWQDKIDKKLEKCPKEDTIKEHDEDIKCLKKGYWSTWMIWKVVMGMIALGTFGLLIYRFLIVK